MQRFKILSQTSTEGKPFSELPPYEAPSTGILRYVPVSILPFAELARIDKPGFAVLWFVHAFGVLHAGLLLQGPPSEILGTLIYFIVPCQIFMSVNFAWNDTCDINYDGKVARTRHRPLVRGAISFRTALVFDMALAAISMAFLVPLPRACAMYAIPMAVGCFVYPLSKRWSNQPQLILGIVLPSGIFMGSSAMGAVTLPYPQNLATILDSGTWEMPTASHTVAISTNYIASIIWTVIFEVIYSFQDARWDEAAGIGTMTRLLKDRRLAKVFLLALAVIQTALHAHVGTVTPATSVFWPLSVGLTLVTLSVAILSVNLDSERSCMYWFAFGNLLTAVAMLTGYAGEYYTQIKT
ncbi:MAG: hypothetical protein Q9166_007604 [cf. Caloplaca sp. 2 TL-2023]